jgi:hypothetical protein
VQAQGLWAKIAQAKSSWFKSGSTVLYFRNQVPRVIPGALTRFVGVDIGSLEHCIRPISTLAAISDPRAPAVRAWANLGESYLLKPLAEYVVLPCAACALAFLATHVFVQLETVAGASSCPPEFESVITTPLSNIISYYAAFLISI